MNPSAENARYNRAFAGFMENDVNWQEKTAAAGRKVLRDHLRENGCFRRILTFEPLDPQDSRVIPALNSNDLVVRKDLEPGSKAVVLTWGSAAKAELITSRRVDVGLYSVATPEYEFVEEELYAFEAPITDLIKNNSGRDIQEREDLECLTHSQASVTATGKVVMGIQAQQDVDANGFNTGFRGEMQKDDIVNLKNEMLEDGNRKEMTRLWLSQVDTNNILKWRVEDTGDAEASKILHGQFDLDNLINVAIIRTIKTDLLNTGNGFGYTNEEFLGFAFILNDVKFWMNKIGNRISFKAWETVGACFGNISSIVKWQSYNVGGDGLTPDALPTEDDLFQQTNPVFSGGTYYPTVILE